MEGKNPEAKVPHRYWHDMWLTDALPTSLDFSSPVRGMRGAQAELTSRCIIVLSGLV
jgi:hypothetical protein